MVVGLIFGLYNRANQKTWVAGSFIIWVMILLALLGWAVFGPAIHR